MFLYELSAIILYFSVLLAIGILSYKKNLSSADFIIGNRSLNYWLTALAAHASDMSSWLFMAYPASIFLGGVLNAWAAIGLLIFMYLNWQLIAPKIRVATEQFNSLTFSSFFESRFADTSGLIRIFTACMSLFFYVVYVSSVLFGLGILLETLFGLPYSIGVFVGILIVIPYVFIGGFLTLAWIDLFQGFFLLGAIIFVPFYLMSDIGGWSGIGTALIAKNLSSSLFPDFSFRNFWEILFMATGWGLGYFGQPHIITKFMGIKNAHEIPKSKWIGMTWMTLALAAATLVGLVGAAFFSKEIADPQHVFIDLVKNNFSPFLVGLILCAVLAVIINAMSSQVLIVSSTLTEDFYKRLFRKNASSKELLFVSRIGVVLIALIAFAIAYAKISTIYTLVLYAWSGLGSSFGPLLLLSLYSKKVNKYGAWVGILVGGIIAAFWPYVGSNFPIDIPPMIPAFTLSFLSILAVSYATQHKTNSAGASL
jgi:sodium/proline symporter